MGKCYRAFSGRPTFATWVSTYNMALVVVLTFCLLANASFKEAPPHSSAGFIECHVRNLKLPLQSQAKLFPYCLLYSNFETSQDSWL